MLVENMQWNRSLNVTIPDVRYQIASSYKADYFLQASVTGFSHNFLLFLTCKKMPTVPYTEQNYVPWSTVSCLILNQH